MERMRYKRGYTLIEILVVISILAVIATCVVAGLPYINKMLRTNTTNITLNTVEAALLSYRDNNRAYPPESSDGKHLTGPLLKALSSSGEHKFIASQIKHDMLVDAWGEPLLYVLEKNPKVWSKGPNRKDDNGEFDPAQGKDDICLYQTKKSNTSPATSR
jgi:prepilin-type N-terminal cleavage/methylation domain-containing protein